MACQPYVQSMPSLLLLCHHSDEQLVGFGAHGVVTSGMTFGFWPGGDGGMCVRPDCGMCATSADLLLTVKQSPSAEPLPPPPLLLLLPWVLIWDTVSVTLPVSHS